MLRPILPMMWMFQHGFTSALCLEKALVIEEFSPVLQTILKKEFGDDVKSIPVSILLYPRRCVFGYENRVQSIAKYVNIVGEKDCAEKVGQKKMVEVLGDVGSTFDYHARFLTCDGYKDRSAECVLNDNDDEFKGKYSQSQAAVDKMVSCTNCTS